MVNLSTRQAEGAALGELLGGINKAQFARQHKVPGGPSMLSQHISGHRPISMAAAKAYADGLGMPVSAFSPRLAKEIDALRGTSTTVVGPLRAISEEPPAYVVHNENTIRVPLLHNSGSMGNGCDELHEDVMHGEITLHRTWVQRHVRPTTTGALRFIHAYGESMAPTFTDGDVLLVDTGARDADIDGIFVLSANQRLYIKRVRQRIDGRYEVSSDNPNIKSADVLDGSHELNVLGRVVWVWNGRKV